MRKERERGAETVTKTCLHQQEANRKLESLRAVTVTLPLGGVARVSHDVYGLAYEPQMQLGDSPEEDYKRCG